MNDNRKVLLIVMGVVALGMILFPPMCLVMPRSGAYASFEGYQFIGNQGGSKIDAVRLLLQLFGTSLVTIIGWFILGDKKQP